MEIFLHEPGTHFEPQKSLYEPGKSFPTTEISLYEPWKSFCMNHQIFFKNLNKFVKRSLYSLFTQMIAAEPGLEGEGKEL